MLRILGIFLTVGAASMLGWYMAGRDGLRRKELLAYKKALVLLKAEIEFAATPLSQAMAQVATRLKGPFALFFADVAQEIGTENVYTAWQNAIDRHKAAMHLTAADWENIRQFGKTLGYLDTTAQAHAIQLALEYVDTLAPTLYATQEKNGRMYRSLGVIGGLLLVVIFW